MQKLVLIDGHAILHRAYHALPPLTNSRGLQTNAIYGFLTMLLKVLEDQKPDYLIVAFDLPQPTFRQQQYTAYQAKRPEMQSNLADQIPLIHELLDRLKIKYFEIPGYEADDLIGTIAESVKRTEESEVVIVSGDRDLLQLVDNKVKLCVPVKGLTETKTYSTELIGQEFGVRPDQWVDVKALKGDASDNYSGVPGIGPKTAQDLIAKYDTLENLYKHLNELKPPLQIKLANGVENAGLAQKLAKIVTDVPLTSDLETTKTANIDWENGVEYMRKQLGFRSLADRIEKEYLKITPPEDPQMKLI